MIENQENLNIWPKIKEEMRWFIESSYVHVSTDYKDDLLGYLSQVKLWNNPKDIYLYWLAKNDHKIIRYMCHDIWIPDTVMPRCRRCPVVAR